MRSIRAPGGFFLATSTVCSKCGFANQAGYQFCTNCGNPLGAAAVPAAPGAMPYGPAPPMAPPAGYPMPYGYGPSPWEHERTKQIDRTKTGILLLLIGSLLSWVPYIGIVGELLLFIGAILVILGRKAFGDTHARNVIISLVLFIVGIAASFLTGIVFAFSLAGLFLGTTVTEAQVQGAFNILLIGGIVVAFIIGIAELLFIYALQNTTGKILLWAAFGATIALQVAIYLIISSTLASAIASMFSGGTPDMAAVLALESQTSALGYLSVVPSVLFAAADYLAWSRINRREIPAGTLPGASAAPGVPPAPPMPPP